MNPHHRLPENAAGCLARQFAEYPGRAIIFVLHSYECQLTGIDRCLCGASETRMFIMEAVGKTLSNVSFRRYIP